ncbi:hypothetical protein L596_018134 [Steinernema carpocapsae]|uniref:CWH43-like N-terminal domain-containing protein n=1 Tax=Steinernema carpocapsae TaxID=34508 RepID=A0A4U5N3S0_STECR|nr:hypothetical protein L596_018134 [Steinernema carpocapsae]
MVFRHAWIFPVLSTLCAFIAFFVCYGIGVARGTHYAWLPYISDGGAVPPQSCIFALFLNLHAVFMAVTVYLRHHQYTAFYSGYFNFTVHWRRFSIVAMIPGFAVSVGFLLVGNFPEGNVTQLWHAIGANLTFLNGVFYACCQIVLAYKLKPWMTPLWLNHTRTGFIAGASIAVIIHIVCANAHPFVPKGAPKLEVPDNGIGLYKPGDPRYLNHIVVTCSEWILAIFFEVMFGSLAWELRDFNLEVKVTRKDEFRSEISDPKTTSLKVDASSTNVLVESNRQWSDGEVAVADGQP